MLCVVVYVIVCATDQFPIDEVFHDCTHPVDPVLDLEDDEPEPARLERLVVEHDLRRDDAAVLLEVRLELACKKGARA